MLRLKSQKTSYELKKSNQKGVGDFSGFPYGESIGTLDMRTFDLSNRPTISGK